MRAPRQNRRSDQILGRRSALRKRSGELHLLPRVMTVGQHLARQGALDMVAALRVQRRTDPQRRSCRHKRDSDRDITVRRGGPGDSSTDIVNKGGEIGELTRSWRWEYASFCGSKPMHEMLCVPARNFLTLEVCRSSACAYASVVSSSRYVRTDVLASAFSSDLATRPASASTASDSDVPMSLAMVQAMSRLKPKTKIDRRRSTSGPAPADIRKLQSSVPPSVRCRGRAVRRPCISRWNRSSSSAATPRVPNASTRPPASSIAKGILSRLWHISATTGASASLSLKQRCRRPRGRQTIARPGRSAPALRSARAMGQAPRVPAGDTRLRLHSRLIAGMSIRAASRRICSTRTAVESMACSQQSSTISMHWLARNAAMLGAAAQLSPNRNPVSPSPDWRCRWRCFG
jgi:hypothetical protein